MEILNYGSMLHFRFFLFSFWFNLRLWFKYGLVFFGLIQFPVRFRSSFILVLTTLWFGLIDLFWFVSLFDFATSMKDVIWLCSSAVAENQQFNNLIICLCNLVIQFYLQQFGFVFSNSTCFFLFSVIPLW